MVANISSDLFATTSLRMMGKVTTIKYIFRAAKVLFCFPVCEWVNSSWDIWIISSTNWDVKAVIITNIHHSQCSRGNLLDYWTRYILIPHLELAPVSRHARDVWPCLTPSCRWVDISTWIPTPHDCLYFGPSPSDLDNYFFAESLLTSYNFLAS